VDKLGRAGNAPWYLIVYSTDKVSHDQKDLGTLFARVQQPNFHYSFEQLAAMEADALLKLRQEQSSLADAIAWIRRRDSWIR
jgi:hypothetical protein